MSADPDISYLAAGISEQILNELAQIPELLVIARTSSFSFRDHEATVADIAEQLNVAYVLEGSVRVDGDRARVTVQLIETGDQSHRWSHTFEREFAYIFALQDEIALAVAEKLQVSLLDDAPGVRDADPEAYVLYLQAQELFYKQSGADDFERSGSLYRRAIEIDPDFVDAISGYARYLWISGETLPGEDSNRARIRRMVDRALAVEPTHPMLLSWRSFFAMVIDNDLDTAARHLERAFESNPTDYQLLWSSILTLPGFGRSDLAAQVGEYLLERDPLCHLCRDATARAHRNLGNFERALELLNTGMALHSDWFAGQFGRTLALVYAGRPEEALQNAIELELQVEEAHPEFAGTTPGHLEALHDLGMMEKFNARLPQYIEMHTADHAGYVAQLYAWIGDADRAFEWLDRIDTTDSYAIRSQLARFGYRSLREDPRMQAVLERYQLTDAQIEAVGLELRLPGGSQQETLGSQ